MMDANPRCDQSLGRSPFPRAPVAPSVGGVPSYLVESYQPRGRAGELASALVRARLAASAMAAEGTPVRHLGSTFLPDDEVCLHLFEAASAQLAREVSRRGGIAVDRVVEALPIDSSGWHTHPGPSVVSPRNPTQEMS